MRSHRPAVGAGTVALLSGALLEAVLPALHLAHAACLEQPRLIGSTGLHLELFAESSLCPAGSYLPGRNLAVVAELLAAASTVGLVAGIVGVLATLGFGVWVRQVARSARDRFRARLVQPRPQGQIVRPRKVVAFAPATVHTGSSLPSWVLRRGPPLSFC